MDFIFFFFKQKTAYEMRISDWRSDVCSSDLVKVVKEWVSKGQMEINVPGEVVEKIVKSGRIKSTLEAGTGTKGKHYNEARATYELKNGRASCRERVCQYV